MAYKIDSNDNCIQNEITRITDEYLKISKANAQKNLKPMSVVDELVDDETKNCEQKSKIIENFISTITETKNSKKNKKNKKAKKNKEFQKIVEFNNKEESINEEEQEWIDLEEEKDEIDINENDFEVTFEINPNAIIPEEIKELGRLIFFIFLYKKLIWFSFLEKKGGEIVKNYEKQGEKEKADKLRKKLINALVNFFFP